MLIQPFHIATRGRLDGVYGIATRGYIVLPDFVSRFPVDSDVQVRGKELVAYVSDHAELTLEAKIAIVEKLFASVEEVMFATTVVSMDLVAVVEDESVRTGNRIENMD